jgi:hypothetical protein
MGLVKAVVAAGAAAVVSVIAAKRRAITDAVKILLHHDEEAAIMSAPARTAKLPGHPVPRADRRRTRRALRLKIARSDPERFDLHVPRRVGGL